MFITLEGIDGCGKSTQAAMLARWMRRRGYEVVRTKEPGGTATGRRLRNIILRGDSISPITELFLYLADRAEHVDRVIRPALQRGKVVISERFSHSTLAYQGHGRGLQLGMVRRLNAAATRGLRPDVVVLLDLSADKAVARLSGLRRDRMEGETLAFRKKVVAGYRALARQDRTMRVVPAHGAPLEVFKRVRQAVEGALERKRGEP